jgi:hypothetical protein
MSGKGLLTKMIVDTSLNRVICASDYSYYTIIIVTFFNYNVTFRQPAPREYE